MHVEPDATALPVVSYGFTTSHQNHLLVARALSTFARGIPEHLIVVATTNAASWELSVTRGLLPNVTAFETGCRERPIDPGRGFDQACKSTALLRRQYAVAPYADWFARVADDCFFVPSHVQRAVEMFNPTRRVYGGAADYIWWDRPCDERKALRGDAKSAENCRIRRLFREVHAGGGSLFVLSRALMSWFDVHGAEHFLRGGYRMSYNDDVGLGAFMTVVANAPVTVMPGDSPTGKFFRVYPNVPLEWQDLAALHVAPNALPAFAALHEHNTVLMRTHGKRLLVYFRPTIDGDAINISRLSSGVGIGDGTPGIGSKYQQFDETDLHVCVLHAYMRLASWHETCPRAHAVVPTAS